MACSFEIFECKQDRMDDRLALESELARARKQLGKNTDERARLVKQLKEKYDNEVVGLKKRVIATENKMIKQAKDFKVEREHCYTILAQFEKDLQQLQEQNHVAEQTLEARAQQIQEKGVIRERIRTIADYIVVKFQACEDMTCTTFFAEVMTFVKQIMSDLDRLQRDLAYRPALRPNDVPRAPGALMLRQLGMLNSIEPKLPNPPPRNLDRSVSCEYCSGALRHDMEKCWKLKTTIQELIDTHRIEVQAPEAPNINQNPLLAHQEMNMIEIVHKEGEP
ncbi:uncharacterized protein [Nicotiana sylvestris]|uniref:uncharacterized protein n=1 Tax=Nicotiana sylvestris TaxID=4096 RepID=UPI00388CA994